jgi:hypothetical protein
MAVMLGIRGVLSVDVGPRDQLPWQVLPGRHLLLAVNCVLNAFFHTFSHSLLTKKIVALFDTV